MGNKTRLPFRLAHRTLNGQSPSIRQETAKILPLIGTLTVGLTGCRSIPNNVISNLAQRTELLEASGLQLGGGLTVAMARNDPLDFLRRCLEFYDRSIRDYRCRFLVRERIHGHLGPEQEMAILFRESPFSVDVRWLRGARGADRVNYVQGRWAQGGKERALVQPHGWIGILASGGIKRAIHAPDVLASSRRPIDEFGFRNTLEWLIHYSELAQGHPQYEWRFVGATRFDGKDCLLLERLLPYAGPSGPYPDRYQRVFIDAEWLVPRACFAYADQAGEELLGSYVARDIEFNVGLTDAHFDPQSGSEAPE